MKRAWPTLVTPQGQVNVWIASVDDCDEAHWAAWSAQLLSDDERARRDRFHFVRDQRRHVLTRALVRHALSRHVPGVAPQDWRFKPNAYGQPLVSTPIDQALRFNVSHTAAWVVVAARVGGCLGVDIESLRPVAPVADATEFFAPDEVAQLGAMQGAAQARRFFDFWTLKESYIKARGMGLSLPLDRFAFDLRGDAPFGFEVSAELDDPVPQWQFAQWLMPGDDTVLGALCVEPGPNQPFFNLQARRVLPLERESDVTLVVTRHSVSMPPRPPADRSV